MFLRSACAGDFEFEAGLLEQVRGTSIYGHTTGSPAIFRRCAKEMPIDVAVWLNELWQAAEALPQGF